MPGADPIWNQKRHSPTDFWQTPGRSRTSLPFLPKMVVPHMSKARFNTAGKLLICPLILDASSLEPQSDNNNNTVIFPPHRVPCFRTPSECFAWTNWRFDWSFRCSAGSLLTVWCSPCIACSQAASLAVVWSSFFETLQNAWFCAPIMAV